MVDHQESLPEGVHHYTRVGEVPWDIQRYWKQRHSIFSQYDQGIWMTDATWFGVTPEPVANQIAEKLGTSTPASYDTVIDAFAGAAGNTIAFARSSRWKRVIAIERDEKVMACAKHNAEVYGVDDKIEWVQGDCFEEIANLPKELLAHSTIFASPPWGGPGYRSAQIFDLETMDPYSATMIYDSFSKLSTQLALFLPRSSDLRQLARLVGRDRKIEVIHYCMHGSSKALCAYFCELGRSRELAGGGSGIATPGSNKRKSIQQS